MIERPETNLKPQFLYIPESFDPATCGHWADYAAYVLSAVNRRIVFEQLDPDGYVPLMSAILKRVLPWRDYRKILQMLIDQDVIECDRSYQVGTKSKGYRLTVQYRGLAHRRHLVRDKNLDAKMRKLREDMDAGIVLPVHRHLWRYLQQIDLSEPLPDFGIFDRQVQELIDKDFRFRVCQYGRVHTNLTNMRKDIRQYLNYQGQELSNLDISNSQPLFLGVVVLNHYINNKYLQTATSFTSEEVYFNSPEILSIFNYTEREGGETPPLCGDITHELLLPVPDDVKRYLSICQSGKLYEYLMEKAEVKAGRDEFKEMFFQVLFGRTSLMKHLPLAGVFEEEFPSVVAVMKEIKRKDYHHMSSLLQRTESSFVVNRVVRRLMNEYQETFISTIHDSFVTTTEAVPLVKRIVLQEFARLGLRPTIKSERWMGKESAVVAA